MSGLGDRGYRSGGEVTTPVGAPCFGSLFHCRREFDLHSSVDDHSSLQR
jgi:hypothetical protein